jgi:hypothetical protein
MDEIVEYFKIFFQHLLKVTEINHEKTLRTIGISLL